MDGWIKFYRKIWDNPVVRKDNDHFAVWCYLLLNATHQIMWVVFNNEKTYLKGGQLITGRKKIVKECKLTSESKAQRILKLFENEHLIEQQTTNKNRLISIVNWDEHQQSEQQIEQQVNNKRTTSEHKQECNNVIMKEVNNNNAELFDYNWLEEEEK